MEKIRVLESSLSDKSEEVDNFRIKIEELEAKIVELVNELQIKNETIAVNNMLHDDFKERVIEKYMYDSEDEMSDYEPDELVREANRLEFWKKKLEAKCIEVDERRKIKCAECDFASKSVPGLKTHVRRRHGTS